MVDGDCVKFKTFHQKSIMSESHWSVLSKISLYGTDEQRVSGQERSSIRVSILMR